MLHTSCFVTPIITKLLTPSLLVGSRLSIFADVLNNVPMDDAERVKFLNIGKGAVDAAPYGSGALSAAALTAAGGFGGQFGGGAANLMGIDPENPGSSNTMGARYSMGGMPPMYG